MAELKKSKMTLANGKFRKELVMPNGEIKVFEYEKKEPSFNDMINENSTIQKEYLDEWREKSEFQYTNNFEENIKDKVGRYMKYKRQDGKAKDKFRIVMGGYIVAVTDKYIALKNPVRNLTFSVQYAWLLEAFVWDFPNKKDKDDDVSSEVKKAQKQVKKELKEEKKRELKEAKDKKAQDGDTPLTPNGKNGKGDNGGNPRPKKQPKLTDEQAEALLKKSYYEEDMKFGRDKLFQTLKSNGHKITRKQVDGWLKQQLLYQLDKPAFEPKDFVIQTSTAPNKVWNIDLVEMDGDKIVLNCVDRFSKYAHSRILRNKTAQQVINGLKSIFRNTKPSTIVSDNGPEFKAVITMKFLKDEEVKQFFSTAHSPWVNGAVEVFNKTMKQMFKKMTYQASDEKTVFTQPILNRILKAYNNSIHSTIQMKPIDALKPENFDEVNTQNQKNLSVGAKAVQKNDIEKGDQVRISLNKGNDRNTKQYRTNWSEDIYFIKKVVRGSGVNPIQYQVEKDGDEDDENTAVKGLFKREEVQPIKYVENEDEVDVPYEISKFLKEEGDEIKVSYKGYKSDGDRWLLKSVLKQDLGATIYKKLYDEMRG